MLAAMEAMTTGGDALRDADDLHATIAMPSRAADTGRSARKPRCEDCFFHQQMLCALEEKKPCPTFRPAHPDGLRPPSQLSFVFRHQRRDPFTFAEPAPL
jgi:hypothetical protein